MNTFDMFQHQINQFGAVTVLDVVLMDLVSEEPLLFLDTLKVSSISMEASSKTIKGGIGAPVLIEYDFGREVNFEMQDAVASLESLSILWGGQYVTEVDDKILTVFDVTTGTAGAVSHELLKEGMTAYSAKDGTSVEVTGTAGSFTIGTEAGVTYKVFAYEDAPDTAAQIVIDSISLPPTVKLVGRTFFIGRTTGKHEEYQLTIPQFKINIGGGLTMEAEGDAAVFDFSGKALVDPITKQQFRLTRVGRVYE